MLVTLAIDNYRSLLNLRMPLTRLTVITGPNGSGKSNLYRALRLLAETAQSGVVSAITREGGLPSVYWAGPPIINPEASAVKGKEQRGTPRDSKRLCMGFAGEDFGYAIMLGLPIPSNTAFNLDPEIKCEAIWANEPETSLHPDLIPALARLMIRAAGNTQVWVISHSKLLVDALSSFRSCSVISLNKVQGETRIEGQNRLDEPPWHWPE